jgi:hypothetical protein
VLEGVLGLPAGRLDEGMYTQAARAAAIAGDEAQVGYGGVHPGGCKCTAGPTACHTT